MRYMLVLIPSEQESIPYVQAAQTVFSEITDGYLLNEKNSLPHVTVCAFHCDDKELEPIWRELQNLDSTCPIRILGLQLKKGNIPPHHYSVGLSVARDFPILHLHEQIVKLLHLRKIQCLNPHRDLYQPHLTLAGISWLPGKSILLSAILDELISMPISPFHLALAKGDDIGQCLEIVRKR